MLLEIWSRGKQSDNQYSLGSVLQAQLIEPDTTAFRIKFCLGSHDLLLSPLPVSTLIWK